ncbi:major capsid protein [Macropodid alphaherpesvirus 1]|uniref:Major capsid protein n=1 Tax=Macropodid alphaherpesvirus 1 TaxID=137443 RepID=A0A0Y0AB29_9ALPH|nr:major capsid protein [Macropodid alphaherpesvirus 1]AMB16992.1 major capsid protein [Macropodid alphaherpesvirus 1]
MCDPPPHPRGGYNHAAALVPNGSIIGGIEDAAHRRLFDFFTTVRSDDNSLYDTQFQALLGTYCSTLSLVRFLELGLSVACVCTKFPELGYTDEGMIQFEVHQPIIARDGPQQADQPIHHYMTKYLTRRSLNTAFTIAAEAMALLTGESLDGTQISVYRRKRAIQQLAQNVQAVLDAFERGSADQMLAVLLEKAPPLALLLPLQRHLEGGRLSNSVARATLIAELKRSFCENSFFLAKTTKRREDIELWLIGLTSATQPSIAMPRLTHSDTKGRPVDGVLVTTTNIKQRLLQSILKLADVEADVPVTYGEMIISGKNLITALVMGKAVRGLDDVARYILDMQTDPLAASEPMMSDFESSPKMTRVKADLVTIGDRLVFLEALEKRIYLPAQAAYPLVGAIDLTFVMPLGLFNPVMERYSTHAGDLVPVPGKPDPRTFPPRSLYFYNVDKQLTRLSLESAMGTVCHSSFMNIDPPVREFDGIAIEAVSPYGAYVSRSERVPTNELQRRFLNTWDRPLLGGPFRWVVEGHMTPEQFLQPENTNLHLELHPAFDFFVGVGDVELPGPERPPVGPGAIHATWRVINGNIPLALCPVAFRDARGEELSAGRRALRPTTIAAVRGAFEDRNYPVVFYLLQAAIHGSEYIFCSISRLISQCIISYWNNTRHAAFVNDYTLVVFIHTYLAGELPEECMAVYRDLVEHTEAMGQLIGAFTLPGPNLGDQTQPELNHLMADPALLPPLIWDCDSIMRFLALTEHRAGQITAEGRAPDYVALGTLETAEFQRTGGQLIHNTTPRAESAVNTAPYRGPEWTVNQKIYYFVLVPAFSRGRCCTAGVRFDRVYTTLQNMIVPTIGDGEDCPVDPITDNAHPLNPTNLVANSLNALFHNGRVTVDGPAMLTLHVLAQNIMERSTAILTAIAPDAGSNTASTATMRIYDGALHAGILLMAPQHLDQTVDLADYFYPLATHALFASPEHITHIPQFPDNLHEVARVVALVPPSLGANYYSSIRHPVVQYLRESAANETVLTYALMASYFKIGPLALYHQLKTGIHPGFGYTVIRQDRFTTENVLFSERASEGYFLGQIQMAKQSTGGATKYELTQPRGTVDLGLGYTATVASALIRTAVTDMGNLPQNFYLGRSAPPLLDGAADRYLRSAITKGNRLGPARPVPVFGCSQVPRPAGLDHGQSSVCEFIATPISADINYFRRPCNPRGRAAGWIYTDEKEEDLIALIYDHTQSDPSYPSLATANPWASQRLSYGDLLYNGAYNLNGASPVLSPAYKFFTKNEIVSKCRNLNKLITEAGSAVSTATSNSPIQFKRPEGSKELVEDPCSLFQEAYPITCATDPALLRETRPNETYGRESHFMQYLVHDASPLRGVKL